MNLLDFFHKDIVSIKIGSNPFVGCSDHTVNSSNFSKYQQINILTLKWWIPSYHRPKIFDILSIHLVFVCNLKAKNSYSTIAMFISFTIYLVFCPILMCTQSFNYAQPQFANPTCLEGMLIRFRILKPIMISLSSKLDSNATHTISTYCFEKLI